MTTSPIRRQLFFDHGRIFVECPRLMSDTELAEVLGVFVDHVRARPSKPSLPVTQERVSPRPALRKRKPR
jgi:hypothetical protein